MIGTERELGTIACTGEGATNWVKSQLEQAGLRTYRSFDLRTARLGSTDCACPYHGTDRCDCQMVVLLVYLESLGAPATVVLHGHQGRTWVTLAEVPGADVAETIVQALTPTLLESDKMA
jgi:hypothetical protein